MRYLKTNTAVRVVVGPFLDVTNGVTPETSLTVTNTTCELYYEDDDGTISHRTAITLSASGGNNDMVHITDDTVGMYDLELTAANVNFYGRMILTFHDDDVHLPVWHEYMVVSAQFYDSMCGTGNLSANVIAISGDTTAADNCELMFDGTGYAGGTTPLNVNTSTITNGAITAAAIATGAIDADAIADNAIDAGAIAADAITAAKIANGAIDANTFAANALDAVWSTAARTLTAIDEDSTTLDLDATMESILAASATIAALPTAAENADAVWDEASTGHVDAGKAGAQVWTDIDAILADTGTDGVVIADGGITAAKIADNAIDNATFAADVATGGNIIATACYNAMNTAFTDATSLTANGLLDRLRTLAWILRNKIAVTDANGNTVIYKDDNTTPGFSVNAMLTDDLTTTTRLRAE